MKTLGLAKFPLANPRLLGLLLAAGWPLASAQAESIDLDAGWHFRFAGQNTSLAPAQTESPGTERVDLPHSWNLSRGAEADGIGWYARELVLPQALAGQHMELHFGAVFYKARIWVNGVEAGAHEGGHTAFDLDVSKLLHPGANRIAVMVDNRPGFATIPGYAMRLKASGNVWYDWWRGGGITRDVSLRISDGGLIRGQKLSQTLSAEKGSVSAHISLDNVDGKNRNFTVTTLLTDPDGRPAGEAHRQITLPAHQSGSVDAALTVPHPQLWNIGDGRLYEVTTKLSDEQGRLLDEKRDTLGFRTIALRDRKLYVNGQPVRLSGVSRHEDSPWEGAAETRGTILKDYRDLAELHTTLTRPIHYPQPETVFDIADRAGMLLIPEIPVWQMKAEQLGDPRLLELAKRMTAEVVAQSGNHPSILAWSVMNECDSSSPQGAAYVAAMKAHLNRIDPGRFVTFADSDVSTHPAPRTTALAAADFIMANAYFGTWSGAASGVGPWLAAMDKTWPDKMLVISEFGWPGPFSADSTSADRDRTQNLREQMAAFAARPFVGGTIFWDYQDYRSNKNLFAPQEDGYVDHGLVDKDRQRRPSFAAWEEVNRPLHASVQWSYANGAPAGFTVTLVANAAGSLPSYPLSHLRLHWQAIGKDRSLLAQGDQALPLMGPGALDHLDLTGAWPRVDGPVQLQVEVRNAQGLPAMAQNFDYLPFKAGSAPFPPDPSQIPAEAVSR
ncbi:glycoside hydrolase family 2 protein [Novosphingobium terrae]|uniref:glycoside hydrolase family 2 protein n=1 Tax=Novosphingobium terrae TaxID=2726189 RepID=UPI0019814B01|nr:glycoside hydrolase family 2 TIM barrel-domain containing protein [Novosphingobium terrae]